MNQSIKSKLMLLLLCFIGHAIANKATSQWPPQALTENSTQGFESDIGLKPTRVGQLVYFYQNERIKVYDLSLGQWVDSYALLSSAEAFIVDEAGLYAAHGFVPVYYPLDHSDPQILTAANHPINELILVNGYLIVESHVSTNSGSAEYLSMDRTNHSIVDSMTAWTSNGHVVLDSRNAVYSVYLSSTNDLAYFNVADDGTMNERIDSPYHGDYTIHGPVYKYPNESRVVDAYGHVFHAFDISKPYLFETYAGELNGFYDMVHLEFYGDLPIILSGDALHAYSNHYSLENSLQLAQTKDIFFIHEDQVHLFKINPNNIAVEVIDVSLVTSDLPHQGIDPTGLSYEPEFIFNGQANEVLLYDKNLLNIFVYDINSQSYKSGFELNEAPFALNYSRANDRFYLAYVDGEVTQLDPDTGIETPFVQLDLPFHLPKTIMEVDQNIFINYSGVAEVYDPQGSFLSVAGLGFGSGSHFNWNPVNRKMYYFMNSSSRNLNWIDIDRKGLLGDRLDSEYQNRSYWVPPLCVDKNGIGAVSNNDPRLFDGTSFVYDAMTLIRTHEINTNIDHCVWPQNGLFTATDSTLLQWNADLTMAEAITLPHTIHSLVELTSGAFISTHKVDDILQFTLHNDAIFQDSLEGVD